MLSIEEIKLIIEKLERAKAGDLTQLVEKNLETLKDIAYAIDLQNEQEINRLDKTVEWFRLDVEKKREKPIVNEYLNRLIRSKIFQFGKSNKFI